ncbi:MAG: hypothetical protein D6744_18270 [Planctomycetota bacterium]|nr:MAG: hypothetical protein D6744_18270 [Planctomycetota bacterium]
MAAAACVATGCGGAIRGHWALERATPNKETFALDDAVFRRDGAYEATLTLDGRTTRESGSYEFKFNKLVLRPVAGGQHKFTAVVTPRQLKVIRGDQFAYLRKVKPK